MVWLGASRAYSGTGTESLTITTTSPLPSATEGEAYNTTISASGGVPPYTWAITAASPDTGSWLSINSSTGVISGTPGTAETESLTVKVTDSASSSVSQPFTLVVNSSETFDYYISTSGDDNNAGTLESPWSITALNSKQSTYGGKSVGLISGTYQYGTVGGVQTTLYSLYQALSGENGAPVLSIQGGTSSAQTYIASCNSEGVYSARGAIIDGSNPSGGAAPTVSGGFIGQGYYDVTGPTQQGYITIDGLIVRNFTYAGIFFSAPSTAFDGLVVKNCELYNGGNVTSDDNPAAIFMWETATNFLVTNCLIHNCQTSSGSYSPWGYPGIMTNCNTPGDGTPSTGSITNCTIYDIGEPILTKNNQQGIEISYCYLEAGDFGTYDPDTGVGIWSAAVVGFVAGYTVNFHHNILVGGISGLGTDGSQTIATINCYNNTFYWTGESLCAIYGNNTTGGVLNFYNNIVWSDGPTPGYENGGINGQGCVGAVNGTGITTSGVNHNAYGANTNGVRFGGPDGSVGITLSAWQSTYGFDENSVSLSSTPFTSTPTSTEVDTFEISSSSPAYTAGVSGAICGAMDGSGSVGCNFSSIE